ncbi:PREDICTED: cytochrome P450 3A9-like [Chrysochloris asiatica]|uniref:Thromboxane-A synthase n=1 Tax=Chrysochloris asiatica TaxID=185453 RepID=A0A9B0WJI3_CHRAS|nr:PREDICTED: cytochrome P450 3A9-like [Chrysochloris asiatica]
MDVFGLCGIVSSFELVLKKGLLEFDLECSKKYGKLWGFYEGRQPILAIMDPAIIKTILVKEFYTLFTNRRNFGLNGSLESSLTVLEDEKWKWIRAVVSPTFSSRKLKAMFSLMKRHGNILVQNIEKTVALDEVIDMKEIFGAYSLDIVTSMSFGVDTDSISNPDDVFLRYTKKLISFSFVSPLIILTVMFPFLLPLLEKMNMTLLPQEAMDFFVTIIRHLKEQRRASGRRDHVDLLQLMINFQNTVSHKSSKANQSPRALTDEEICAQATTFVFAGYETTSLTLSFIAYNLAIHPEVQAKLQEEIDRALPNKKDPDYDILFQLEYLDMVVNETLRLFPLGGRLERVCKKSVNINGVTIPQGTLVIIPTYVLHRDPKYWPKAEEFRPERFSKDNMRKMDPYVFLPFGLGPRMCVGMRFALLSIKLVMVLLLQNFSLETCKETPIPLDLDTSRFMHPKKPIMLKLTPRRRVAS